MEKGDLIYLILMIAVGIISAFRSKKKKNVKPASVFFEEAFREPEGFDRYFKDPEIVEKEIEETQFEEEIPVFIPEPVVAEQSNYQKNLSAQKILEKEEMIAIYGSNEKIEEYDYNDSDILNININDDIKIDESIDFNLEEAVIYSEILKAKYI